MVTIDEKNRVALPKEIIEKLRLKDKILLVDLGDHIGIYPVPRDPFERLHGSFNTEKTFKELRKKAEEMAIEEVARIIISMDNAYGSIPNLTRYDPDEVS